MLEVIGAGVVVLFVVVCLVGAARIEQKPKREEEESRRHEEEQRRRLELERQRTMLYDNLTVDEAQRIVWGWEEMSQAERGALPLERRVEIRKIREDLEEHKRRWDAGGKAP